MDSYNETCCATSGSPSHYSAYVQQRRLQKAGINKYNKFIKLFVYEFIKIWRLLMEWRALLLQDIARGDTSYTPFPPCY